MEWCKDDALTLIKMYKDRENLWNCTSNEYKNKNKPHDVFDFFRQQFSSSSPSSPPSPPHPNRKFEGPAIAMGGNWMTKVVAEKIKNKFLKMLYEDTISQIRGSCDCNGRNWVTKIAAKKIELTFRIFSAAIAITQFPPIEIAGSSNLLYCVVVQYF